MRILIDSDNSNCKNLGDLAMLQVTVQRFHRMWPDARLEVLTRVPDILRTHCPEAIPLHELSRASWLGDDYLLGALHQRMPKALSHQIAGVKRAVGRYTPIVLESAIRLKANVRHLEGDPRPFLDLASHADLAVVTGTGGFTDSAVSWMLPVLDTVEIAIKHQVPTALLGQGIGPLEDPKLRARAKAIFPEIGFIFIREQVKGRPLLESLGVKPERIICTGDDAIELAYNAKPDTLGDGIGVNIRVARNAAVTVEDLAIIRPVLHKFARQKQATLVPIPIAIHKAADDAGRIQALLEGYDRSVMDGDQIETPSQTIQHAGRCRIVVTGAYHAAVFALSQGIPTICLAHSQYYIDKFVGLRDQFGEGCTMLMMGGDDFPKKLAEAFETTWTQADFLRPVLLEAAAMQIKFGQETYQRLASILK